MIHLLMIEDGAPLFNDDIALNDVVTKIYDIANPIAKRKGGRFEPETDDLGMVIEEAANHDIDVYVTELTKVAQR